MAQKTLKKKSIFPVAKSSILLSLAIATFLVCFLLLTLPAQVSFISRNIPGISHSSLERGIFAKKKHDQLLADGKSGEARIVIDSWLNEVKETTIATGEAHAEFGWPSVFLEKKFTELPLDCSDSRPSFLNAKMWGLMFAESESCHFRMSSLLSNIAIGILFALAIYFAWHFLRASKWRLTTRTMFAIIFFLSIVLGLWVRYDSFYKQIEKEVVRLESLDCHVLSNPDPSISRILGPRLVPSGFRLPFAIDSRALTRDQLIDHMGSEALVFRNLKSFRFPKRRTQKELQNLIIDLD